MHTWGGVGGAGVGRDGAGRVGAGVAGRAGRGEGGRGGGLLSGPVTQDNYRTTTGQLQDNSQDNPQDNSIYLTKRAFALKEKKFLFLNIGFLWNARFT
jgi:hypothetical protein